MKPAGAVRPQVIEQVLQSVDEMPCEVLRQKLVSEQINQHSYSSKAEKKASASLLFGPDLSQSSSSQSEVMEVADH